MGWIKMIYDWDWTGADTAFKRALELEPANADVLRDAATLAAVLGHFDEAIALNRRAIELDPLLTAAHFRLGLHAYYAGQLDVAEQASRKALELNPQRPQCALASGPHLPCAVETRRGACRDSEGARADLARLRTCACVSCSWKKEGSGCGTG